MLTTNGTSIIEGERKDDEKDTYWRFADYQIDVRRNKDVDTFVFLQEMATGGEVFDQVVTNNGLPWELALKYFRDLAAGVAHMHDRLVAHMDLKLENLLLTSADFVKIIDLGLAERARKGRDGNVETTLTFKKGTPGLAAPEIMALDGLGYADVRKADVWSAGVCLFIMVEATYPFGRAEEEAALVQKLADWQVEQRQQNPDQVPNALDEMIRPSQGLPERSSGLYRDLINGMLQVNPDRRWSMKQVLERLEQGEDLEPGWSTATDRDTGRDYYWNQATGERTWIPPLAALAEMPCTGCTVSFASVERAPLERRAAIF